MIESGDDNHCSILKWIGQCFMDEMSLDELSDMILLKIVFDLKRICHDERFWRFPPFSKYVILQGIQFTLQKFQRKSSIFLSRGWPMTDSRSQIAGRLCCIHFVQRM
jgi:hypothetical protein